MINVPAKTVAPNAVTDILVGYQTTQPWVPMILAPANTLDPSWNGVSWMAWTEPDGIRVRITNPTSGAINLAAQSFTASAFVWSN